jgi:hypothetical protein
VAARFGEGAGKGFFRTEPFLGSVRISETGDALLSYELNFADATRGLGTIPHGKHLRRVDWVFRSSGCSRFQRVLSLFKT